MFDADASAGIAKPATPRSLRHSFATHLLDADYEVGKVHELPGHAEVSTTTVYTQVLDRRGRGGAAATRASHRSSSASAMVSGR